MLHWSLSQERGLVGQDLLHQEYKCHLLYVVNNKPFNITIQGSTPLTSTLTTPSPMNDLNGTEVLCMAIDDVITSSATIHITEGGTCFVSYRLT